jgi:hypothetical protein
MALVVILALLILISVICVIAGPQAAGSSSPSPSPSASPTASPTPTATPTPPASTATVRHALRVRRSAVKAWRTWNRARSCFDLKCRPFASPKPPRSAPEAVWTAALQEWRAKRADLRQRTTRLVYRMKHPGGSSNGRRWIPLALWVGWPRSVVGTLAALIMNESSGIQDNISPTDDWGLTQLHRSSWAAQFRRVIGTTFEKGSLIAEKNLRFALYIWRVVQHRSFLPAWNGDAAVS